MAHHPQDDLLASSADLKHREARLLMAEAREILEDIPAEGIPPAEFEQLSSIREDLTDLLDSMD